MSGWQPISTAPLDGKAIWAYWIDAVDTAAVESAAFWDDRRRGWFAPADPSYRLQEPDGWRPLGGGS